MNVQKFAIEHTPTCGTVMLSIDFDFKFSNGATMDEMIKEMAEFWSSSKYRLNRNKGNYLHTFLKKLCNEILVCATADNLNVMGIINEFKNKEGYCGLDGESGIKLLKIEQMQLDDQDDYKISII